MKIARHCVCCDSRRLARTPAVLAPFLAKRVFDWEPADITAEWGLRDLKQGASYAPCYTLECGNCGLLFAEMRFDDEEMNALYSRYRDTEYTAARDHFEPGYAARNKFYEAGSGYIPTVEAFLAPFLPAAPRVLDYGGDTGQNTPFRGRAAAHDVLDISGLSVIEGARLVSRGQAQHEHYDLIASIHVLEHVSYPLAILSDMAALARDTTLIYIEVPLEEIIRTARRSEPIGPRKRLWHEHINFFTGDALSALMRRAGLRLEARLETQVEAGGGLAYIQCLLARRERAPSDIKANP